MRKIIDKTPPVEIITALMVFTLPLTASSMEEDAYEKAKNRVHQSCAERSDAKREWNLGLSQVSENWTGTPLVKLKEKLDPIIQNLESLLDEYFGLSEDQIQERSQIKNRALELRKDVHEEINFEKELIEIKLTFLHLGQDFLKREHPVSEMIVDSQSQIEKIENFRKASFHDQIEIFKSMVDDIIQSMN